MRAASAGVRSLDGLRLKLNVGGKVRTGISTGPGSSANLSYGDAPAKPSAQAARASAVQAAPTQQAPAMLPKGADRAPAPGATAAPGPSGAHKRAAPAGEQARAQDRAGAAKHPRLGEPGLVPAKGGGQLQLSATAATHVRTHILRGLASFRYLLAQVPARSAALD